jgi:hypothetical protein
MKQFLKSVFVVLRKTNEAKSPERSERENPVPALVVRSQVKAGTSFQWGVGR